MKTDEILQDFTVQGKILEHVPLPLTTVTHVIKQRPHFCAERCDPVVSMAECVLQSALHLHAFFDLRSHRHLKKQKQKMCIKFACLRRISIWAGSHVQRDQTHLSCART